MKIVKVEAFPIQAKPIDTRPYWGSRAWGSERAAGQAELSTEYPVPLRRRFIYSQTIDTVVVRIETDGGLVGWGEAKAPVAPQATAKIIELLLTPIVMGADPREVLVLWERMYAGMRVRGHRAGFYLEAIAGVDIALWDIAGQAAGAPISTLLGGKMRESVRVYASGIPSLPLEAPDEAIETLVEEARSLRAAGYTGVKMAIGRGVRGDLRTIGAIRDAMGDGFSIYADAAGVYSRADAMRLGRALRELGVGFFEMPIPPEDVEGYAELAQGLDIPIALDSIMSRHETVELIRNRAIDIVQPDVCRAGGITECRRIAELADCFGLAFQPHVSIGSQIHVAASAHLAVAMPNSIVCEYWIGKNPLGPAVVETPVELRDGYLFAPAGDGLGIRIKPDVLLSHVAH
ncbi:MAG TPA: mandelate racemase/muconate lactonizing enzyme family protein [Sphingomonas sp.]|uniref:mandelate racemase/muconate lactonizing enzyme family protein n=1 Tax=Sphingomonas sp. TaxID=28214 RepID=UPI002C689F96|nr:mandelate racemase/muconate lactonizing enzyme family protein [Sphingomonas sp.]HMI18887.1 mandelate racemase/muconate lactonizing enzyme family protein [Sphingomonas sp.]